MSQCPACGHDNIDGVDHCDQCQADLFDVTRPENGLAGLSQRLLTDTVMELNPAAGVAVVPEQTISKVVQTMCDEQASAVVVVHRDQVVGIFTERDFLMKVADRYEQLKDEPVRRFMTSSPECLETSDSIAFGLNRMAVKNFRHIPILDDGRVRAVVRTRDVLNYLANHHENVR